MKIKVEKFEGPNFTEFEDRLNEILFAGPGAKIVSTHAGANERGWWGVVIYVTEDNSAS